MDWLRQVWFKLSGLWRGRARDAEMAEEMGAHLDRLTAANQAAGMSPAASAARWRCALACCPVWCPRCVPRVQS